MKRLRFTLSHQVLTLVAVSILAAQVAGLIVLLSLPPRPAGGVPLSQVVDRTREAIKLIAAAPPEERASIARRASDHRLIFSFSPTPPQPLLDPFSQRLSQNAAEKLGLRPEQVVAMDLGPIARPPVFPIGAPRSFGPGSGSYPSFGPAPGGPPGPGFAERRSFELFLRGRRGLAIQSGDGWLRITAPSSPELLWLRQVGLTFAITLAALLAPALWLANRIASPIRAFAQGAERFGVNPNAPLLPEEGPYELRQATGAFNVMQNRIRRLVSDRTMMMAAVSHDLRTPLARIRFRINDLPPKIRDGIAGDIEQMDDLIDHMLAFTREALPAEDRQRFDLSALAHSLVDDLSDAGAAVTLAAPGSLIVEADMVAVRRILGNLLDNAVKYAGHARVTLECVGDQVLTLVEDDGPGVPPTMHQAVFEPFHRVEPSRNRKTGGVGLGLAIARNLARGHGGDIALDPMVKRGARFIFTLPSPPAGQRL